MTSFAIVPAAGRSVRMGRPKLLLPWGRTTVIEHVLDAWNTSAVDHCVVVVHPDDAQLAEICRRCEAEVVTPAVAPPEMKDSVQAGLTFVAERYKPRPEDFWLLAPADMPGLTRGMIDVLLVAAERAVGQIVAPRFHNGHGHPVVFPWPMAVEVARLRAGEGINAIVDRSEIHFVDYSQSAVLEDMNNEEEYERLREHYKPQ